jgi:Ser/Thr protein kinase RdoA (MazF antagonist)
MAMPASWIATRPTADVDAAADALERWWGIRAECTELAGERDRNFLVRPRDGAAPMVLKIANLVEDPSFLACQGAAMARLAAADLPVARVVRATDGRELVDLGDPGPPWARVLTWLPGRPMAEVDAISDELLSDLGSMMGRSASALVAFDHPAAHRVLQWDVRRSVETIELGIADVTDPDRAALLGDVAAGLRDRLAAALGTLRLSVIHNDANDHNVLVDDAGDRVVGLLDFGDLVHSVTAQEAGVALAYAMFHRPDPMSVVGPIVAAFDRVMPLTDAELEALPDLVVARLAMSVAISAHQGRLDPDPYLRISEAPAWDLLGRLRTSGRNRLCDVVHEAVGR